MISYDILWETMRERKISQYKLIKTYKISKGQISRLKHNESVTTNTIDILCDILDCEVYEVMTHIKKDSDNRGNEM